MKFPRECILFPYFFLNERNIKISLLKIHFNSTVVHCANLNSNYINKLYTDRWICYFVSFNFLFMLIFVSTRLLSKGLWKQLISLYNENFYNTFQGLVYYRILGCQFLWYYNGGSLNKRKNMKKAALFI